MKSLACLLSGLGLVWSVFAQQNPVVNFNLVQVNQYQGEKASPDTMLLAADHRVVIDMQNPEAMVRFFGAVPQPRVAPSAPIVIDVSVVSKPAEGGRTIPWESGDLVRALSGQDSFLVKSSRVGCPGTEVRPSVSVAFSTPHGWSDPPIRFGPLTEHTLCPLGNGYQLEVSCKGDSPPTIRLIEPDLQAGRK